MYSPEDVGKRIQHKRESRNLTQKQFAELMRTTQAMVWKWEDGIVGSITAKRLAKIAEVLGCSTVYLKTGYEGPGLPPEVREWANKPENVETVVDLRLKEIYPPVPRPNRRRREPTE